jgi:glycosyltransferase involved in cell wall biosynthesis
MNVSVVIPCYRCPLTVGHALLSVFEQTSPASEVLLVDDASGDDTPRILEQLASTAPIPVSVVSLPVNSGAGVARNEGWDRARGDYVAFLDADDWWLPDKLKVQLSWLAEHPDVAICGHLRCIGAHSSPAQEQEEAGPISTTKIGRLAILLGNPLVTSSVVLRRDLRFRFPAGIRLAEDYHLWRSVVLAGLPVVRLNRILAATEHAVCTAGASADLAGMQRGVREGFARSYREGQIGGAELALARVVSEAKYARRLILARGTIRARGRR